MVTVLSPTVLLFILSCFFLGAMPLCTCPNVHFTGLRQYIDRIRIVDTSVSERQSFTRAISAREAGQSHRLTDRGFKVARHLGTKGLPLNPQG